MKWIRATLAELRSHVLGLHREDTGATATEYAVLVGFIAMVIVVGVASFGVQLNAVYGSIVQSLSAIF